MVTCFCCEHCTNLCDDCKQIGNSWEFFLKANQRGTFKIREWTSSCFLDSRPSLWIWSWKIFYSTSCWRMCKIWGSFMRLDKIICLSSFFWSWACLWGSNSCCKLSFCCYQDHDGSFAIIWSKRLWSIVIPCWWGWYMIMHLERAVWFEELCEILWNWCQAIVSNQNKFNE